MAVLKRLSGRWNFDAQIWCLGSVVTATPVGTSALIMAQAADPPATPLALRGVFTTARGASARSDRNAVGTVRAWGCKRLNQDHGAAMKQSASKVVSALVASTARVSPGACLTA